MVDYATDRVYQFDAVASRTSGSITAASSFSLTAGNTNPQGIADPPVTSSLATRSTEQSASAAETDAALMILLNDDFAALGRRR